MINMISMISMISDNRSALVSVAEVTYHDCHDYHDYHVYHPSKAVKRDPLTCRGGYSQPSTRRRWRSAAQEQHATRGILRPMPVVRWPGPVHRLADAAQGQPSVVVSSVREAW